MKLRISKWLKFHQNQKFLRKFQKSDLENYSKNVSKVYKRIEVLDLKNNQLQIRRKQIWV